MKRASFLVVALAVVLATVGQNWKSVDPRIGSVGVGRTFPGPSMPFGMVKPGPDCGILPNAGWSPMPAAVTGFSQTHVSGTGGGQKYGNILLQPLIVSGEHMLTESGTDFSQRRKAEEVSLGYYSTTFENGICTEITTAERCAFYRFHYPSGSALGGLLVDATHYLGKDSVPDRRERQQLVGAEVEVVNANEVRGFSRVRGGWNNGDAYTVHFWLRSDRPFTAETNSAGTRSLLHFSDTLVNISVGISYISALQARSNIVPTSFDQQLNSLRQAWSTLLDKVHIEGSPAQRRMFYTALYHTMLMPVDKSGENPKWTDTPYYDDYYAIWDTYRTSSPLLTLLCPDRESALVNSLINIYVREGYMPDARSGDCNGRTQGGSNAEVMIADAFVKGLTGIDYEQALQAMLKDGECDPGADHEKHGRGGLTEYLRLGYIPYGTARAGNRTVEYSFNDFCIAQVAGGLGHQDLYDTYMRRSSYWRNLWRADYEYDGMRGFIMPRDAQGLWLDSVPWGRSKLFHPTLPYTPVTKVAPWHLPWWDTFFYEATSQEYSLNIPHDVPGLIEACGGTDAFVSRLNRFFERGYYNVQNEPSFLTPTLYHWAGRPELSTRRIHHIIASNYSDQPDGLPGNDDSGAMSSWLAFHMMGLYPNAGMDYYLLNIPLLKEYTLQLSNGKTLHATRQGKGDGYRAAYLNGRLLSDARLGHADLMGGGELVFVCQKAPPMQPAATQQTPAATFHQPAAYSHASSLLFNIRYPLNRQTRTWPLAFCWDGDTLRVVCKETAYHIPRHAAEHATSFCWLSPQSDGTIYNNVRATFAFVSSDAIQSLNHHGSFIYDGITWRRVSSDTGNAIHVRADIDGTELWIEHQPAANIYLVSKMSHNPLGIDWEVSPVPVHND